MRVEKSKEYFDYQPSMRKLVELFPIQNILEFGLGEGTKFLLENNRKVTSCELLADPKFKGWFELVSKMVGQNPKWRGIYFECPDEYTGAVQGKVEETVKSGPFDFVFVDPGTHFRPLIVKSCINLGVPIIAAHDTNLLYNKYTWDMANPDKRYYEVTCHRTTYYFKNEVDYLRFV